MLTVVPGNPLSSVSPGSVTCGKDVKAVSPVSRQRSGKLQRRVSSQQSCLLGIETWQELVWENWELGRDITINLTLKNVRGKLRKLRFKPPESKFFTTLFPQVILLSPGTSFSLPITFRPLERCEYEDHVEFQCKDGSFRVRLRATLPCHVLEVPESVLLPPCAVAHSSQTTFSFRNVSSLQTTFHWESAAPFNLSPEQGVLSAGQECRVTVVFQPHEALVYQRQAGCRFGDHGESNCTVLLLGLSKYPCFQLRVPAGTLDRDQRKHQEEEEEESQVLAFGPLAVGTSVKKHFEILNHSPVKASFTLCRLRRPRLSPSAFHCDVARGEVAPGATARVPVTFSPLSVDSTSMDYLSLSCPGALSNTLLKLTGSSIGPVVSLSAPVMDCGCVEEGGESQRLLRLVNTSSVEAHFQFDLDGRGHSVFSLQPLEGRLAPHSHLNLRLVYRPSRAIAHHKRLACLILHREPLFLDVIGTCHSEQLKPAILLPRHLALYQRHQVRGLTWYPPDILSAMLTGDKIRLDQEGALCLLDEAGEEASDPAGSLPERSSVGEYYQACAGGKALSSPCYSAPHVTVEPSVVLFNHGPSSSSSSFSQSVTVTNHTKGKISLAWTPGPDSPFSVSPGSCDLGALKTTSFRVTYAPQLQNCFHGAQLECFAVYKVLRDYRHVDMRTLCPPWCLTVRVVGHSFQPGREHFVPHCSLQHPQVLFPAVEVLSYRTVLLQNSGDLPLTFHLDPEQSPGVCVVPTAGLVPPGAHQILTLRTTPSEDSPAQGLNIPLQLNACSKHTQTLSVINVVEKPCVSLEGKGSLFFKPTAAGSTSTRLHRVRNRSRLPLGFEWKISGSDGRVLSVEPQSGELQPNESGVHTWTFNPLEETVYTLKPHIHFWPIQNPACRKSHLQLKVLGMSSKGSIQADSPVLDLGEVLVGDCRSFEVPLVNNGPCPVTFCLAVQRVVDGPGLVYDPETEPNALELDPTRGTIPSRSRLRIRSTLRLARRTHYRWTISYQTLNSTGMVQGAPQSVCEVRGEGVYPTLEVTDIRSAGSLSGLSKLQLWKLFSLDELNQHLRSDPAPPELTYRVPTRHSLRRCPSVFTTASLDFNFGAAPVNSEPSTALLMLDNTGCIPVDWSFLLPEDQLIELECWAETGEFSSGELQQMKVQDNRLFSVSPRSGTLLPGQQRAVHCSYRHDFASTARLPVLFKLSHGREILMNFQGVTLHRDRPYLHFTSSRHLFTPVAIGGFSPPRQVYELYNGGAVPVRYQVDTVPLEQLREDNFGHGVLRCLNPRGEVLPGRVALLKWILSPLEAKTYSVDISIAVEGGDSMLVTFEGCGFDARLLGQAVPLQLYAPPAVPTTQKVALPGQVVFLSEERVSLGDVPVRCASSRLLFLTNVSHTHSVLYAWDLAEQQGVQMTPERGRLSPGENVLCVLTLITSACPSFYQLDLVCQVTNEEALAQYHDASQRWEQEEERKRNEFTLTEKDLRDNTHSESHSHAKTLPPIRAISGCVVGGICSRSRRSEREVATAWPRPLPPRPALLHLGVTARSHSLLEYHTHFSDELSKHHVYRSQPSDTNCEPPRQDSPTSAGLTPLIHGPERDILTHTLTSLLRSLLDDPAFHHSLTDGSSESVPYFSQLLQTPPLPPPLLPPSSSPPPASPCSLGPPTQLLLGGTGARSPELSDLTEEVLLNTLQNLMMEAFLGELVLTARPRIIALPPATARRNSACSWKSSQGRAPF
ncbi:cilia- and flagella-associated protein 65 [Aplochiton taeniatus]